MVEGWTRVTGSFGSVGDAHDTTGFRTATSGFPYVDPSASRSSRAASSGATVLMLMAELSSNPAGVESLGMILMCQQKTALGRPSASVEYTTKL
jgi:hypothetical protein